MDYSRWMGFLPESSRSMPLSLLAIPGSHDSGAYWLNAKGPVVSEEVGRVVSALVRYFGIVAKLTIRRWSITQNLNVYDQLLAGVRYLDIRLGMCNGMIRLVHGLYGYGIEDVLTQVRDFLDSHPSEVVLLDFNHFYDFSPSHHSSVVELLVSRFGTLLCVPPSTDDAPVPSLNEMNEAGRRVIAFYDDDSARSTCSALWPSSRITSPWPNTDNEVVLARYLREMTGQVSDNRFSVVQGVLTPQTKTVLLHLNAGLRRYLIPKAFSVVWSWIQSVVAARSSQAANIIMVDCAEMGMLVSSTVSLNFFENPGCEFEKVYVC